MALVVIFGLIFTFLFLQYWSQVRKSCLQGIPEPPGNFIFGHALSLIGNIPETFLKWKIQLGPVYQIRIFSFRILVLGDKESITKCALMHEAAGRPRFGMFRFIKPFGYGAVNSEGPNSEEQRQFYLHSFRKFGIGRKETEETILNEVDQVLQEWKSTDGKPFGLDGCLSHYVINSLWSVLGTKRYALDETKSMVERLRCLTAMDTMAQKMIFIFTGIVDKVSTIVQDNLRLWQQLVDTCYFLVKEHMRDRVPQEPRDVIDMMLDRMDATEDPDSTFHRNNLRKAFMLTEVLTATIDTTTKTLEWFLIYLSRYPEVRNKLKQDIISVVGHGHDASVQLRHRDQLPYAEACIYELLRISSVGPFAIPHSAMEDFHFEGAKVAKGTIILMNLYAMHHDPTSWDRPDKFDPMRFLRPDGQLDLAAKNNIMPFGVGRRSCLGSNMALDVVFLLICNLYRDLSPEVHGLGHDLKGQFGVTIAPPPGLTVSLSVS